MHSIIFDACRISASLVFTIFCCTLNLSTHALCSEGTANPSCGDKNTGLIFQNFDTSILANKFDVTDWKSGYIYFISSKGTSLKSVTDLTQPLEPIHHSVIWLALVTEAIAATGINPISTSPSRSLAAQSEGLSKLKIISPDNSS